MRKEEQERRQRRRRNLIWRGAEGKNKEERRKFVEGIIELTLGRGVGEESRVKGVKEREGEGRSIVLIVEMGREEDKRELIRRNNELWRRWKIVVDEDLTWEERGFRWKMVEKAREERAKGRVAVVANRRIWIDGREIVWDEGRGRWVGKGMERKRGEEK